MQEFIQNASFQLFSQQELKTDRNQICLDKKQPSFSFLPSPSPEQEEDLQSYRTIKRYNEGQDGPSQNLTTRRLDINRLSSPQVLFNLSRLHKLNPETDKLIVHSLSKVRNQSNSNEKKLSRNLSSSKTLELIQKEICFLPSHQKASLSNQYKGGPSVQSKAGRPPKSKKQMPLRQDQHNASLVQQPSRITSLMYDSSTSEFDAISNPSQTIQITLPSIQAQFQSETDQSDSTPKVKIAWGSKKPPMRKQARQDLAKISGSFSLIDMNFEIKLRNQCQKRRPSISLTPLLKQQFPKTPIFEQNASDEQKEATTDFQKVQSMIKQEDDNFPSQFNIERERVKDPNIQQTKKANRVRAMIVKFQKETQSQ